MLIYLRSIHSSPFYNYHLIQAFTASLDLLQKSWLGLPPSLLPFLAFLFPYYQVDLPKTYYFYYITLTLLNICKVCLLTKSSKVPMEIGYYRPSMLCCNPAYSCTSCFTPINSTFNIGWSLDYLPSLPHSPLLVPPPILLKCLLILFYPAYQAQVKRLCLFLISCGSGEQNQDPG